MAPASKLRGVEKTEHLDIISFGIKNVQAKVAKIKSFPNRLQI